VIVSLNKQQIPPLRYAPVGMTWFVGGGGLKTLPSGIDAEDAEPVGRGVGEVVGRGVGEGVGL
jgi:hypothetical protein